MRGEWMRHSAVLALGTAGLFAATAITASATGYDCNIPGETLSIIIDPADPYRPMVVGNRSGVPDRSDVKFTMEVFDGGFSGPGAEFLYNEQGGTFTYEGMEYDCREQPAAATPAATAGALLEAPGLSYGGKVRSGPGTKYPQVGSLFEGDRIKIVRNTGVHFNGYDWFEVQQGDLVGYHWGGLMCSNQPVAGVFQQCRAGVVSP